MQRVQSPERLIVYQPSGKVEIWTFSEKELSRPGSGEDYGPRFEDIRSILGFKPHTPLEMFGVQYEGTQAFFFFHEEGYVIGLELNPLATRALSYCLGRVTNSIVGPVALWVGRVA